MGSFTIHREHRCLSRDVTFLFGLSLIRIPVFIFFLKHLSGSESSILESDWLIAHAPAARIFPSRPREQTSPVARNYFAASDRRT